MKIAVVKKINDAPKTSGVYIFFKNKSPLYIGKAANLRSRLKSYLRPLDAKTQILQREATGLKLIKLSSPIEALIKESQLIKTFKPQLNVYWCDDKNYFYITFTKEKFPKIFITHRPAAGNVGPFTDGGALRLVLRILRRRYPYCTCNAPHLRECLNSQIGLCPGYCCNKTDVATSHVRIYKRNISIIKNVLSGKRKGVLKKITQPSDLWAMENILSHKAYLDSNQPKKIECYDISHFSGKEAVGAMTTLGNKNEWRYFKIKYSSTNNDPQMIAEIVERRLRHPEWPYPDLIIVDGGITQYNAVKKVLGNLPIKLISFAKPKKKIYGDSNLSRQIVEKAINQTHRFVIGYHRRLRDKIRE